MFKMRFIWNYRGHNDGFFSKGPNWFQLTLPPSRKAARCALICSWHPKEGKGQ